MRPATDSTLRKRLAALLEARTARERADAVYKAASRDWIAAGDTVRARTAEVADLLKREGGVVTYDGYAFQLDSSSQLRVSPVAREIRVEQTSLLDTPPHAA